jgi:hypothetical protein
VVFDSVAQGGPGRFQRHPTRGHFVLLAEPAQRGFDVGLLVGKRLGVGPHGGRVQAFDVEPRGRPAGRQGLHRLVERTRNLTQRRGPLRALLRRQLRCLCDCYKRIGEGGFEEG